MIILQQQQVYNELIKFLRLFFMLKIEFKREKNKSEGERGENCAKKIQEIPKKKEEEEICEEESF